LKLTFAAANERIQSYDVKVFIKFLSPVVLCVTDSPWLLKTGTLGPSNRMVNIDSNFTMHCRMPRWTLSVDPHWFVYFTLTSIHCHLYPFDPNRTECSQPYDTNRFTVSQVRYMLLLQVTNATLNDTGLYTCVRPAYFSYWRPAGLVGYVAMIRKFFVI